jgi:hypothetical protein
MKAEVDGTGEVITILDRSRVEPGKVTNGNQDATALRLLTFAVSA